MPNCPVLGTVHITPDGPVVKPLDGDACITVRVPEPLRQHVAEGKTVYCERRDDGWHVTMVGCP